VRVKLPSDVIVPTTPLESARNSLLASARALSGKTGCVDDRRPTPLPRERPAPPAVGGSEPPPSVGPPEPLRLCAPLGPKADGPGPPLLLRPPPPPPLAPAGNEPCGGVVEPLPLLAPGRTPNSGDDGVVRAPTAATLADVMAAGMEPALETRLAWPPPMPPWSGGV